MKKLSYLKMFWNKKQPNTCTQQEADEITRQLQKIWIRVEGIEDSVDLLKVRSRKKAVKIEQPEEEEGVLVPIREQ